MSGATRPTYTEDNDTPGASNDTPISRATVLQMQIDELDAHLQSIRERRLLRAQQLATVVAISTARATIDQTEKLDKAVKRAKLAIAKAELAEQMASEAINKARAIALTLD